MGKIRRMQCNGSKGLVACAALLLISPLSWGRTNSNRHVTFAERPSRRSQKALQARQRAALEKKEAREWAAARGISMRHEYNGKVRELMAIRDGRPVIYSTKNADAAISTTANLVRDTSPYNVDGSGVTVGVWDGGAVLSTHSEFSGNRVTVMDGSSVSTHATHVGGTIAADGDWSDAQGMAPEAHLDSYDWESDISEMTGRAAAAPGSASDLYLSNHSYGYGLGWSWDYDLEAWCWYGLGWDSSATDPWFGMYMPEAAQWDGIVYDAPYYLPFKAAGNDRSDNPSAGDSVYQYGSSQTELYSAFSHPPGDGEYDNGGYDTMDSVSTAKNIMTVGAVDDAVSGSSRSLANAEMSSFSGWGPADDGRIKPDIVANGVGLTSLYGEDGYYATGDGTSMATPNASGSAALLVDYYDNLFPSQAMRASTLKGLIIHTADDLGNAGPDYQYGWGLMDTLAAAELIKDVSEGNTHRMTEAQLVDGSNPSDAYSFYSDGGESIRITLCWTDPAGEARSTEDDRTSILVNDLDLRISGPGGTEFYAYKLDVENPADPATATSENDIDNVEQVYIQTPSAGAYTVTVDFDGSLEDGDQYYSLLVDGLASASDTDGDDLPDSWEIEYFGSSTGAEPEADPDGDGADNLTEYISGHNPTDSGSVFEVVTFASPDGGASYIVTWDAVEGRIYNVGWSGNLLYAPLTTNSYISDDLPYPVNSYTDNVPRTAPSFYRVDVRLDQ